jgi:hypothetical protein
MNFDKKINLAYIEFKSKPTTSREVESKLGTAKKNTDILANESMMPEDMLFELPQASSKIRILEANSDFMKRMKKMAKIHV